MSVDRMMPPLQVSLIEVIFVERLRGDGTLKDPVRSVYEYYSKDGKLLAEQDTRGMTEQDEIYLSPFSGVAPAPIAVQVVNNSGSER